MEDRIEDMRMLPCRARPTIGPARPPTFRPFRRFHMRPRRLDSAAPDIKPDDVVCLDLPKNMICHFGQSAT
jgi:hypothetical protein